MRRIPDTITEEEFKQIIKEIKSNKRKLAFMLGFYQCMRVSEVVKLLPEHIDYNRRLITIKQGKGSKDRNIPIAPEVLKGLKYLPINVDVRALQISFKKYSKKILGKNLHFHSLRHSGATHYLNVKKWNLRQVQVFLGHARISTTEIYTHVNPEDLVGVMWDH
jgi:integrase